MATYEISTQDLPLWMRRARRGFDWGIIVCIAFSIIAASPFLFQPGLPRTNANENHVFRTADYAQAISEGRLYPRWSPNVLGGYGAPIPSFVPPGAAYFPALIQFFFTDDPVLAVRIVYVLSITFAGTAVYTFVMRRVGAQGAVLACALYVFSPYLASTAPYILGDLPSVMSLMLLPTLLWSVDRLLARNRPPDVAFVALTSAGLLLTHPAQAIVGFSLGSFYMLWFTVTQNRQAAWHLVLVGFTLGIGMSAFYWLPALAERGGVIWTLMDDVVPLRITFSSLLAVYRLPDPNELVHTPQLSLGIPLVIFTAASLLTGVNYRSRVSFHWFFLVLGLCLIAIALWITPREIWLLGPSVLCLSIAGSSLLLWEKRASAIFPAALIVAIGLSVTSWFAPQWSRDFGSTDAPSQIQYEQLGYGIAVLPPGTLVPITTSSSLLPDQTLMNSFASGSVRKIAVSSGVQVGFLNHFTHGDQFQVNVQSPGVLQILTSYFPGWSATLNNTPLLVHRDPSSGLINLEIPTATSGELVLTLGTTPLRTGAWLLAQVSLGVAILFTLQRFNRSVDTYEELKLLTTTDAKYLGVIVIGLTIVILLVAAPGASFHLAARPGYELQGSTRLQSRTDVGLEALAYRLDDTQYSVGETISLSVYWRALRFLPTNYRTQVSVIDPSTAEPVITTTLRHPGGYPTQRWLTNLYVTDRFEIDILNSVSEEYYVLGIEVFNCTTNCTDQNRLTFFNSEGANPDQILILPPSITIIP
jgi:hypothetical protein